MKIKVLNESGYEEAALGFSLSYNTNIERAKELLPKFAFEIPGENKFLESIVIWLDVIAPRFWWQEADTYRIGSTKQSESTMHTILKKPFTNDMFEYPLSSTLLDLLNNTRVCITTKEYGDMPLPEFKNYLPEGFLQRRIWCINYKTLQNIYIQRKNHRLPQWTLFLDAVLSEIEHPEFIKRT